MQVLGAPFEGRRSERFVEQRFYWNFWKRTLESGAFSIRSTVDFPMPVAASVLRNTEWMRNLGFQASFSDWKYLWTATTTFLTPLLRTLHLSFVSGKFGFGRAKAILGCYVPLLYKNWLNMGWKLKRALISCNLYYHSSIDPKNNITSWCTKGWSHLLKDTVN